MNNEDIVFLPLIFEVVLAMAGFGIRSLIFFKHITPLTSAKHKYKNIG